MRRGLLSFAVLAAAVSAQTVTTVLNNGTTQSRYDLVILGDGYQAFEQNKFNQDVQTFLTALFQKEPYQTFSSYYNVHTVFRASAQSGADRPDETPPVFVNTAYEATYDYGGVDRCLYIQNTSLALADAALAPATEGRVLVMVNDTRYGGCASTFAVSYTGSQMVEVQAHELGHSLGLLADEYDYPNNTYTGPEPGQPNITTSPTGQKWSLWHGTQGISAFQGAGYYQYGLYRPRNNCLMRALGQVLCRVCQEAITKVTNSIVDVITSTMPASANVTVLVPAIQNFSFSHFVPAANNPIIEWRVDGVLQAGANSTTFALDSTQVALGAHTVEARVIDQSDRVRSDPSQVMHEVHTWSVSVSDPSLAQLRVPALTCSHVTVLPGDAITVTATITNDGPAAAGPFAVDVFLADNLNGGTVQDTYLGRIDVAGLSAGQTTVQALATQLPWSLPPQVMFLQAVADRTNAVAESNENDNRATRVVLGQTGPCTTGLEFQDQLVTPFAGELSLSVGGTVHPTVVAPCANPATTLYLIAWTGSGTQPGTQLAPGLVLPLNVDGLTQIGLDGLNGPVFGQFLGVLDSAGIGRAQFTLPVTTALPAGPTHFATVLLGASQLFSAVSNPIELMLMP